MQKAKDTTPPKWADIYPQGTKRGDEEQSFFIVLARNKKWPWRSTSAIAKETNLTKERVEEIIAKYYPLGMIFQNPANEDQWGYWERHLDMLPKNTTSISQRDQDARIGAAGCVVTLPGAQNLRQIDAIDDAAYFEAFDFSGVTFEEAADIEADTPITTGKGLSLMEDAMIIYNLVRTKA